MSYLSKRVQHNLKSSMLEIILFKDNVAWLRITAKDHSHESRVTLSIPDLTILRDQINEILGDKA